MRIYALIATVTRPVSDGTHNGVRTWLPPLKTCNLGFCFVTPPQPPPDRRR